MGGVGIGRQRWTRRQNSAQAMKASSRNVVVSQGMDGWWDDVVSPLGFEPRTHALKGRCSTN
jgi:hypothetical protein